MAKILIFDSGFGGLSILREIRHSCPACELIYCSDNRGFPYGTKTENEVIARVSEVLLPLVEQEAADIVVIACNTASTVALPVIRNRISEPVVGVVPAIKPAAQISKTDSVGLLATPGTVKRDYTQQLIEQFGNGKEWLKVGSSELVEIAEQKMYGQTVDPAALQGILKPFAEGKIDTIVLACTHFPLLATELQKALPDIEHWVDSGAAIARRVQFWLDELGLELNKDISSHKMVFTVEPVHRKALDVFLQSEKLTTVEIFET